MPGILLQAEVAGVEDRERRAIELRVKDERLPRMKTLAELAFARSPSHLGLTHPRHGLWPPCQSESW
jgi:hypothetical protein